MIETTEFCADCENEGDYRLRGPHDFVKKCQHCGRELVMCSACIGTSDMVDGKPNPCHNCRRGSHFKLHPGFKH